MHTGYSLLSQMNHIEYAISMLIKELSYKFYRLALVYFRIKTNFEKDKN